MSVTSQEESEKLKLNTLQKAVYLPGEEIPGIHIIEGKEIERRRDMDLMAYLAFKDPLLAEAYAINLCKWLIELVTPKVATNQDLREKLVDLIYKKGNATLQNLDIYLTVIENNFLASEYFVKKVKKESEKSPTEVDYLAACLDKTDGFAESVDTLLDSHPDLISTLPNKIKSKSGALALLALHHLENIHNFLEEAENETNPLYLCCQIITVNSFIILILEKYPPTKKMPTHLLPFDFYMYRCTEEGEDVSNAKHAKVRARDRFLSQWVSLQIESKKFTSGKTNDLAYLFCEQFTFSKLNPDVAAEAAADGKAAAEAYTRVRSTLLDKLREILNDINNRSHQ